MPHRRLADHAGSDQLRHLGEDLVTQGGPSGWETHFTVELEVASAGKHIDADSNSSSMLETRWSRKGPGRGTG